MKTAISLPDKLFIRAESVAAELEISRSELYARALAEYLDRRSAEQVTARLDKVYGAVDGRVDAELDQLARRPTSREDHW